MLIKCPHDGATMKLDENKHVCPECDNVLSISEADKLFEAGEVVAIADDSELIEADKKAYDDDETVDADKEDEVDEDKDFEDDEDDSEAEPKKVKIKKMKEALSVKLSDYGVVSKILRAGKKGQMSEAYMTDLVESLVEDEDDMNIHMLDMAEITEWAEGLVAESAVISEDLVKALAGDESLSEEVKSDVVVVFEAALNVRAKQIKEQQAEVYATQLEEAELSIREAVEAEVDGYLDTVVTEWMADNKLAVESGMKVEMTESFLEGLHDLYTEHYIDIPEGKEDVLESLANQVSELEDTITEMKNDESLVLAKIVEMKQDAAFKIVAEGLADTSKEKLAELAESVEFVEEESYKAKLLKLKESFLSESHEVVEDATTIVEDVLDDTNSEKPSSPYDYISLALNQLKSNQ